MKKLFIFALCLILAGGAAFARGPAGLSGIGVFGTVSGATTGSTGGGVGINAKFGSFPVIGIQYDFSSPRFAVSCDYYVLDAAAFFGPFTCFVGVGAYGGIAFGTSPTMDLGARFPLGIQLWPVRKFELYLAAVPVLPLLPKPDLGLGAEAGFRLHF